MASEEELFASVDALLNEEPYLRLRRSVPGCGKPPASRRRAWPPR
ncbi:hypothetical protein [Streptomyces sp. NPDC002962]